MAKKDLTQQYLEQRFGAEVKEPSRKPSVTRAAPAQPEAATTPIGPAKPLPPTPGQRKKDREDAQMVARQMRGRRLTATEDVAARTTAAKDLSMKVVADPEDADSIVALQQNLVEIRKKASQAPRSVKSEAKEVKKKIKPVEDAIVAVQKGRWGAKKKLERASRDLDAAGDKLTSYTNTSGQKKK